MAEAEFAQERLAEASIIWERLERQLAWHSDRSRSGKKRTSVPRLRSLSLGASRPFHARMRGAATRGSARTRARLSPRHVASFGGPVRGLRTYFLRCALLL